nr:Gag-Pol polyprotein [Tanacetum cinerariifolium]
AQKKQQSLYDGKLLLEKHDPPVVHDSKETLQLAQESHVKIKQMNKEIKPANYTKINHLSGVFVPQKALSRANGFLSMSIDSATRLDVNMEIVMLKMTVNDLEKVHLDQWRITEGTKDTEKGKIRLLFIHQLIWSFVMTSANEGSVLGVTSSSNSFCPKKHWGLRKYQHYPSSLNESTISSFDNAILLWSPWNGFLMKNADTFIIVSQIIIDKFSAIIGTDESDSFF